MFPYINFQVDMNSPPGTTAKQHDHCRMSRTQELDALLEARYIELFGEEHHIEDLPSIQDVTTHKIQQIKADKPNIDRRYEKAMAEYRRSKEAEITRYNFSPDINIPESVYAYDKTLATINEPQKVLNQQVLNQLDEVLEIEIDTMEKKEIDGTDDQIPNNDTISKKKQKKEMWKNRRNMARRIKRGLQS